MNNLNLIPFSELKTNRLILRELKKSNSLEIFSFTHPKAMEMQK